ncbi:MULTISPECIES: IclR family transcriptional regulator [Noviherbaspirillum]|uniref:IclR family transcriptional regulator n=1 Tax=Noviherbaspirillum TaxID=1344552 RepID=UPI001CEF6E6A|nr:MULTISPECIES: helix-turn-helix domain-containing protein [Noviherbaspirillum]
MEHLSHIEEEIKPSDDKVVSALARGIQILQCFSSTAPELSARELIAATGLSKATFFRLTYTLCSTGLLRYTELTGRFAPAPGLLTLATPLLARMNVRQIAFGQMQALADRVHGQVSLALGAGLDLVFIDLAQSRDCATFRPAMGAHISLSRTASGRAYLCSMPTEQADAYMDELRIRNPEHAERLTERLDEARRDLANRGFCVGHGDLQRQVESVAVPVRSTTSDEIYVFACTVSAFELTSGQLLDDVGPRLVTLAHSVEASLGRNPDTGSH